MLDQNTVDKLHAMRFPKMAEAYILQSKDPRYEAQSFEERFAALVDAEYQNRIVNRRRRLIKAAKLEQSEVVLCVRPVRVVVNLVRLAVPADEAHQVSFLNCHYKHSLMSTIARLSHRLL